MATTKQIIREFLNGATKGKAASICIDGDKLFNYNTVIAQRFHGVVVLNMTKYSVTTSKHQNALRRDLWAATVLGDVPMGCQDLTEYVPSASML